MSTVDDSGLEVLRKSAIVVTPTEYKLRTDANVTGGTVEATPSGLFTAYRVTTMNVTTTAAPIPATPLTDRNMISIQNKSETETIYIGPSASVTADSVVGTTSGWEIPPLGTLNYAIKDTIVLYAIANSTVLVKVSEGA